MPVFFQDNYYPKEASNYERFVADCLTTAFLDAGLNPKEYLFSSSKHQSKGPVFDFTLSNVPTRLPKPFDIFPKNCHIEVKRILPKSILGRLLNFARHYNDYPLYFIVAERITYKFSAKNVVILDAEFFQKLVDTYPFIFFKYFGKNSLNNNFGDDSIKNFTYSFDKQNITEESNKNTELFKKWFKNKEIPVTFILGNGVSNDFGAASWSKLVENITDYLSPMYTRNIDQLLNYIGNNLMSGAEVTSSNIDADKFSYVIYNSIYGKYEEEMLKHKTYLSTIGDVLESNKDITVATYNYDCFLEMCLKGQHRIDCISPYSGKCKQREPGKKTIYHLHGVIPYGSSRCKPQPKGLVFTQTDYYRVYASKNWTVKKQIEWFNKSLVLFLGSSLTDVYQLSLLYKHAQKGTKNNIFALLAKNGLTDDNMNLVCKFYAGLGVKIIFVDNFSDLPTKLLEITN